MNAKYLKYLLFIWLLLIAPNLSAEQKGDITTESLSHDTITIASEPDYPPYCLVDEKGNATGFSVDLFKASAEAVGLEVYIKIGLWNIIKQDLAQGKIDALPLVGKTPEREEIFDFTMPYLSLHGAVFVREDTSGINSTKDLKNREIVVMKGDNAEEFVLRENISTKIFTTRTYEEAFKELAAGKYDALITQRIMGIELLKQLGIRSVKPLDWVVPEFRQDFCFAVQKGNKKLLDRLNEGLSIVIANNTYESIKLKWFGPSIKEKLALKDVLTIIFYTLIPLLILVSGISIVVLRKEVKRRTESLNSEISEHKKTLEILEKQQVELRENEGQIRLLLNSTAEGIYGVDINGDCTFINKSVLKILGYSHESELIGKNMHELIHHTRIDGSRCCLEDCKIVNAFKDGKGTHYDDEIFWGANGVSFPVEYFSYPICPDGKITGFVVTFWDIYERKKADQELLELKNNLVIQVGKRTAELQEKVEKLHRSQPAMLHMVEDLNKITAELKQERRKLMLSNQELEAFTYSVSHDLRAPLRAIDGFSKFLVEDYAKKLDDEGKRFIDIIRQNAVKMDRLIVDLLGLSRVSRVDINPVEIEMDAIVQSIYHELATDKEKNEFELTINKMPLVSCDVSLIKQVWRNLLGNALKYSSKSPVKKIEIKAEETEQEGIFSIKDHGAGFDGRYVEKLFGIFQRLHKDEEFEGIGVGLAIVQRIVHRHGGRVWAEGKINHGAAFYFSLPRKGCHVYVAGDK